MNGETGEVLWFEVWASANGQNEAIFDIALDSEGNIFTVGRAFTPGYYDLIVQKYHWDTGFCFWSEYVASADVLDDVGWSIVVGLDDNPVVTGIMGREDGGADFVTAKFASASGARIWTEQHPGAVNNIEARTSWLVLMDDGDVVMGSRTWSAATGYDVVLHRYASTDGDPVWTRQWNSGGNRADDARALVRDAAGDLLVCGVSASDYFVLKVDGDTGAPLWNGSYQGPPNWYDAALVLAEAPDGTVVTSGFSDGQGTGWDVATVGFDPTTGDRLWDVRFDFANQTDEPRAIAISPLGDVFITGYVYSYETQNDLLALCYRLPGGSVAAPDPLAPLASGLTGAWPNPFNPRVSLGFALPAAGPARLAIHDLRGREVAVLADGDLPAGDHVTTWNGADAQGRVLPAGVYLAVLRTAEGMSSRKVVMTK